MTAPHWTREIIRGRALEYLDQGDLPQAVSSATNDAAKREAERAERDEPLWAEYPIWMASGMQLAIKWNVAGVRAWIEEMP